MRQAKLVILIILVGLSGCASAPANVDMDHCEDRGHIDGIHVGRCPVVKQVR